MDELLKEAHTIQRHFLKSTKPRKQEDTAKIFAKLVMEGKVSAAIKFLEKEHSAGVMDQNT